MIIFFPSICLFDFLFRVFFRARHRQPNGMRMSDLFSAASSVCFQFRFVCFGFDYLAALSFVFAVDFVRLSPRRSLSLHLLAHCDFSAAFWAQMPASVACLIASRCFKCADPATKEPTKAKRNFLRRKSEREYETRKENDNKHHLFASVSVFLSRALDSFASFSDYYFRLVRVSIPLGLCLIKGGY